MTAVLWIAALLGPAATTQVAKAKTKEIISLQNFLKFTDISLKKFLNINFYV